MPWSDGCCSDERPDAQPERRSAKNTTNEVVVLMDSKNCLKRYGRNYSVQSARDHRVEPIKTESWGTHFSWTRYASKTQNSFYSPAARTSMQPKPDAQRQINGKLRMLNEELGQR